jgi:hypothetical protein
MSNTIIGKMLILLLTAVCVSILILSNFGEDRIIKYDCRDAHWRPDVPVEVKKQCIEFMKQQIENSKKITT